MAPVKRYDIRLVLYQPDIPQNAGAILRLGACLGAGVDLIEPLGFLMDDRHLRRAGMDYRWLAESRRHASWQAYRAAEPGRLVLLTTRAAVGYLDFAFRPGDRLLLGGAAESVGAPNAKSKKSSVRAD